MRLHIRSGLRNVQQTFGNHPPSKHSADLIHHHRQQKRHGSIETNRRGNPTPLASLLKNHDAGRVNHHEQDHRKTEWQANQSSRVSCRFVLGITFKLVIAFSCV